MPPQSAELVWTGAWLVATYKGFSEYNLYEPTFDQYEATILSARAANLLSSIRRLGPIEPTELEVRRKLARLKPSEVVPLVTKLADLGVLQVDWKTSERKEIQSVAAGDSSRRWVFEAAGRLFYELDPTEQEQASLFALDLTSVTPLRVTTLREQIAKKAGFSSDAVSAAINHLTDFGMLSQTRETESGDPIISNPYAFRSLGDDTGEVLSALSEISPEKALELLEHVKKNPGIPLPAGTDQDVLKVLINVGLIDHSGIKVQGAAKVREFPTIPHLWGVFNTTVGSAELDKDLLDDAKLFLNSIRYGEIYSRQSHGRINDPVVLVDRLISRGEVGPATAIGSDYPLPLSRGIVSIVESRINPGRYHMQLRKEDVAKSVLEILQQGTVLGTSGEPNGELLGTGGQYQSPETLRVARKLPSKLQKATEELAFELRSHRKKR